MVVVGLLLSVVTVITLRTIGLVVHDLEPRAESTVLAVAGLELVAIYNLLVVEVLDVILHLKKVV